MSEASAQCWIVGLMAGAFVVVLVGAFAANEWRLLLLLLPEIAFFRFLVRK